MLGQMLNHFLNGIWIPKSTSEKRSQLLSLLELVGRQRQGGKEVVGNHLLGLVILAFTTDSVRVVSNDPIERTASVTGDQGLQLRPIGSSSIDLGDVELWLQQACEQ